MTDTKLDRRLNAYRDDLADSRLRGMVSATRFVDGQARQVLAPCLDIVSVPSAGASLDAQLLFGQTVREFESEKGWSWVQSDADKYVGYVETHCLTETMVKPTHIVCVPRTFLYGQPDLKTKRALQLSMGSLIAVTNETENRGTDYLRLSDGRFIIASHAVEIGKWESDPVSVAETLLHTPYLWGGNSAFGIDCSGLVWLSMIMCGETVHRDSDMQLDNLGQEISLNSLRRGDLVFWKGHVGWMKDTSILLHANGHTMTVAEEPLTEAIQRIGYLYGDPTSAKRL